MSTDADLAASFFGGSMPTKPAAEPARAADQDVATTLFGATTGKHAAPPVQGQAKDVDIHSDAQMARAMFTGSPIHGDAERAIAQAAREQHLANDEDAEAAAQSWVPTLDAFELNATESKAVTELAISATANPPDQETIEAWHQDSLAALRQEHGPRAGEALQLARQLVARDPAAFDLLHRTGLGNHPHIVRTAAARAMSMKKAGKL